MNEPVHNKRLDNLVCLTGLALTQHRGRANGASAAVLSVKTGLCERSIRSAVSELRARGVAVVGVPETGYYIAEKPDEIDECCRFLRSRALHSLTLEARLRKIALPTLLGQMQIELNQEESLYDHAI